VLSAVFSPALSFPPFSHSLLLPLLLFLSSTASPSYPLACYEGSDTHPASSIRTACAALTLPDHQEGMRSIHLAITCGHVEMVTLLMENGANPKETPPVSRAYLYIVYVILCLLLLLVCLMALL
jgi:hypothetical protein